MHRAEGLNSSACSTERVLCAGRHCSHPAVPCLWPSWAVAAGDNRQDTWHSWMVGTGSTGCMGQQLPEKRDLGEGKKDTQLQKRPHPSAGMADAEVPWVSHPGVQILVLEEG